MSKQLKPRDLEHYTSADMAAKGLEDLARDLRASAGLHPLVKWHIHVFFWNPRWETLLVGAQEPR